VARIRQEDVEQVRERTDIIRLVQQYVALKKQGRSFTGLCPFHTEKTPSFTVDQGKQVFYCFGCGKGGNAYHFIREVEGLTFPEAVERLAGQAGITLRYEGLSDGDRQAMGRRQALFRANERAAELYQGMLLDGKEAEEARAYLASRSITKETAAAFGLGYAAGYSDFLLRRMAREFSPQVLVEAGLAIRDPDGGIRDRFRARVMFPVHDLSGRAVGFGARLLQGEGPKYLNSPETPVYRKGEMLYNLHRAKAEISSDGRAHVVEGYTDVIALAQAGVPTAVATCGTALSEGHFRLLARFARQALLAFDSDEAGARAAERAYGYFEAHALDVRVLVLPEGKDPADVVQTEGPDAYTAVADGALPLVEYMIRRSLRGADLSSPEGQARAVKDVLPIVTGLNDPVLRSRYAGLVADMVGVSDSSVLLEVQAVERPRQAPQAKAAVRAPVREVEREALKLLVQSPEVEGLEDLTEDHFTAATHRKVFGFLRSATGPPAELVGKADEAGLARILAELAVDPLNKDPDVSGREYAERVSCRLEEFFLSRQIDSMKKRLERLNPLTDTAEFDSLYEDLIGLEGQRRKVRTRTGEGA
jgi:DNA primase